MNRFLLSLSAASVLAAAASAQVSYSFNFDANSTGWTGNFSRYTGATACGGVGGAMRRNLYSGATTGQLISPIVGTSLGGTTTITFDYKVANWSANTVGTPAPFGTIDVQYGATATGPWTTFASFTDEAQTGSCLPKSYSFTPPAGALYIRWSCVWASGASDAYWNVDNVALTEVTGSCSGTPTPGNVTGAPAGGACAGGNFTLGLQNGTSGSGVTYQWYSSTVGNTGPWTSLGTSANQTTSQTADSWYYCDVTCAAGPATGSSTIAFVPMSVPSSVQDWSTGTVTPNCWSISNPVGTYLPDYSTASGFGAGTGSVRFNFYNASNTYQLVLTSPTFAPVAGGTLVYFDFAGQTYNGGEIDHIVLEESNDGGGTWTQVVDMSNEPVNGLLNTAGIATGNFVPTAGQWGSAAFPLLANANRIRFRGVSNFGNSCYLDNVSVGVTPSARNTTYGGSCVSPAYGMTASPAPVTGNTVVFNQTGIPEAAPASGVYFGVVVHSFGQLYPGIPLNVLTAGAVDSPCALLVASVDVAVAYVSATPTDSTVSLPIPLGAPVGALVYSQGVALIVPVAPNNAGIVTSNGVRSFVNTF